MRALVLGNAPLRDMTDAEPAIARQMRISGVSTIEPANGESAVGSPVALAVSLRTALDWH